MEQEGHSVTIKRSREDYFAFSRLATKALRNTNTYIYYLVTIICAVFAIVTGLDVLGRKHLLPESEAFSIAFSMGVTIVVVILIGKLFKPRLRQEYLNENHSFLRQKRMTIDKTGLREKSDVAETFVLWQGVERIERTRDLLLVYIDKISAFCIPVRNFTSPQLAEQFYENMLTYWREARDRPVPSDI